MDIDQDIDMLGGEFSWVPPNDTSEVAFYVGYFANTPGMLDSGSRRFEFEILGHLNSYDLPFQTPQSGYSYFSIYTKSSLAEQTTPNSVEVIDFCQNVPTLENQSLYVEEGVHLLDIYDVPEVVITKFTGVSEDGLSLEFAPLRRGPVYMIITDTVAVAGMTNTDVQSLANALGGPNCRIPGNLMVSCTNITFQLYGCSLSVGGSFNYRLWLLQEDGETGTIGEAAYIDFIVASVVFDQGPFIYFRNASSVALQYIPSHEGFEWMYAVPTAGGYADQALLGDDRIMWVRRVKSMYLASEGRKCQNARVPIFGKEAKISFLYDCEFTLGQEYRIFILLEDGFNRHDGTLKTVDFVYQGEMTVNSAIPYSHPVPSATRWRLVPLSLVSTEWKVQHLQMFSDVTCSRRVAAYPAPYRDLLLSTWDEGQPLPTGFPFSDPGPLPLESLFEDGRMGPGFLSGRPCGPGDCHIGFSFGSGLSGANDVNVAVKVGCVEVMQSDASGEFAESLELQYYDGSQYVSYRQAFNLAGGISFVPTFNGTVGLHVVVTTGIVGPNVSDLAVATVCPDWRWSLCAVGVALGPLGFLADPCWRFVGRAPGAPALEADRLPTRPTRQSCAWAQMAEERSSERLVRPEVIYVETLMASEDVFLVNRDSNLEEVVEGRIALQGAPRADFLRYGDLFSTGHQFALPSGVLMGLANAWQYFEGGVRFPFLAPPVLTGPVRPFYGVYAYPHPVTHFDMLIEWLRNSSDSRTLQSALDVGTGCGVVALMLRRIAEIPDVVATDVSPNAVYGAREELKRQGLDDVEVLCSDLFTGMDRKFDLVVFNPPWLPLPQPTANEPPRTVLDLGNFYSPDLFRRFFDGLPKVLNSDGRAVLLFSNHATIRGYVDQHPFKAVMDCGDLRVEKVLSRDFDVEGRRRRTGRPQVKPSLEPAAELWAFVVSEPLQVPVLPGHVPLFSAKAHLADHQKQMATAVLSIGRLFSAEAQALMARSLVQRIVSHLRQPPGADVDSQQAWDALDALKRKDARNKYQLHLTRWFASMRVRRRDGSLHVKLEDLRSPLTAAIEHCCGQELLRLDSNMLGLNKDQLRLAGQLCKIVSAKSVGQLDDIASQLSSHFGVRGSSQSRGASGTSSPPPLPPKEVSRSSFSKPVPSEWSPDILLLVLELCQSGTAGVCSEAKKRQRGDYKAKGVLRRRVSLQQNLPNLAKKLAIWTADRTVCQRSRQLLLFEEFYPVQADNNQPGFNDLLEPFLRRLGQDIDPWVQPTALLEDPWICKEQCDSATFVQSGPFTDAHDGQKLVTTTLQLIRSCSLEFSLQRTCNAHGLLHVIMGQGSSRATTIDRRVLSDGRVYQVKWPENGGLGYMPWPGSFMLAKHLDMHREQLGLQEKKALELGSGTCSVAGLAAGLLCKQVDLTDRLEVLEELHANIDFAYQNMEAEPRVMAKVLDWVDLEFTESAFRPGHADLILMSDVVYFPHLRRPLLNTLLYLCTEDTLVLWANCDKYPEYEPDIDSFLELLEPFFRVTEEEEGPQKGFGGPCEVSEGVVKIRSLRILNMELAQNELARAKVGGPGEACIKRCGGQSVFHVICAHFFCFDCASQQYMKQQQAQANEYFCPTCRATAHEVMPMPDIAVNPRFQFLDVNRSGEIDQNMAVQALEAMLPIDTERLHESIAGGWAAWAKGHVTENDFFSKGGLLEWIRAHQHDLANAVKRGAAPSLPADDLQDWFRHWDVEHRGTLDKGQVLRALCEASKTSSLETRRIQELKEGITKVWDKYDLSLGLTRQHCKEPKLAADLAALAEKVAGMAS
ncbi:METTL21C [Symbiodinium sp. KB8]|nr:METTL21C [Symbiodinium sp. KB8]